MDYYIHPIWFWLLNVADTLRSIAVVIFAVSIIGVGFRVAGHATMSVNERYNRDDHIDSDYMCGANMYKASSWAIPVAIVSGILMVLIPSEKSMVRIMVASLATKGNVESVISAFTNAVDYILEAIK